MKGHLPPHSNEAERAVLGALLLNYNSLSEYLHLITPDCFYNPCNGVIYGAILDLISKEKAVDYLTVMDYLKSENLLDQVGGLLYLTDLADSIASVSNIDYYVKIILEKYKRRQLINESIRLSELAYDQNSDLDLAIEQHEQAVFEIGRMEKTGDLVHFSEYINQEFEETAEVQESGLEVNKNLISTGISDLDIMLNGGLNPTDLIFIGARPAMGKTSFVLNLAVNIAEKEKLPVAVFSMEMSGQQLTQKMISFKSDISLSSIRARAVRNDFDKYTKIVGDLQQMPIYIDDSVNNDPLIIKSKCRRLKSKLKGLGAIIVDYLQLMGKDDADNPTNEVSKHTRQLKKVAKELGIPVIVLSQLSRAVEQRQNKRPQLSDLRQSGSIEQDADIVGFIYRDEYYYPDSDKKKIAELILAKHRNGPVGTVELFFDAKTTGFSGLEKSEKVKTNFGGKW